MPAYIHSNSDIRRTSCGCTEIRADISEILPGKRGVLRGIFSTTGLSGDVGSDAFAVFESGGEEVTVLLRLKASVKTEGRLRAVPNILRSQSIHEQTAEPVSITVVRDSKIPVRLVSVQPSESWLQVGETVEARRQSTSQPSIRFGVTWSPHLSVGRHDGSIEILTEHDVFGKLKVPVTVEVLSEIRATPETVVSILPSGENSIRSKLKLEPRVEGTLVVTSVDIVPPDIGEAYFQQPGSTKREVEIELTLKRAGTIGEIRRGTLIVTIASPTTQKLEIPIITRCK